MVPYPVRVALQSLRYERWINLLSMITIAMGLLVVSLVIMLMYNVDLFTRRLPERFSLIAYLNDGVTEQNAQNIVESVRKLGGVEKVRFISKAEAMKELKSSVRDADYILEGLNENPLPASIEIRLRRDAVGQGPVRSLVSEIRKISGIEDVQYGERLLVSIQSVRSGVQTAGLVLSAVMTAGIIFICYSTVKILFYRRKEEIETLKLLGATRGFIRMPFLVEGGIIGLAGAGVGLVVMLLSYSSVFRPLTLTVPLFSSVVFPFKIMIFLPVAGLFLGITGALIAIGRIRF